MLSAYLFQPGRSFLSDSALFAAIAFHVSQIVCSQIDRLKSAGLPVLLFVDEPAMCLEEAANADSEEIRLNVSAVTPEDEQVRGAYAGLPCCAGVLSSECVAHSRIFFPSTSMRGLIYSLIIRY